MKKALLTALFITFAASWCLAQTDSLPAPTAEPCKPAACEAPCQTGACAEPFVPKWAVGLSANSITNIPGSIFFQRYLKNAFSIGAGFGYSSNGPSNNGRYYYPSEKYTYTSDTRKYNSEQKSTNVTFAPEFNFTIKRLEWLEIITGLNSSYTYTKVTTHSDNWEIYNWSTPAETLTSYSDGWIKGHTINVFIPLILEKTILLKKYKFAIGLATNFINITKYIEESVNTTIYIDNSINVSTSKRETPLGFEIKNPLQTNVSLKIKYFI